MLRVFLNWVQLDDFGFFIQFQQSFVQTGNDLFLFSNSCSQRVSLCLQGKDILFLGSNAVDFHFNFKLDNRNITKGIKLLTGLTKTFKVRVWAVICWKKWKRAPISKCSSYRADKLSNVNCIWKSWLSAVFRGFFRFPALYSRR